MNASDKWADRVIVALAVLTIACIAFGGIA